MFRAGFLAMLVVPAAADQFKADNNLGLEQGGSWSSGSAPAAGEFAIWDARVATPADCTNTLGATVTWGGIVISNPAAPVYLGGNSALVLANRINLAGATADLTIDCNGINLGGDQVWTVAAGRALTTGTAGHSGSVTSPNNGNFIITKTGGGLWSASGNGDNGSMGIQVNQGILHLAKSSSGGVHAVGGPGLTVAGGGVVQITGPGGDQVYDGAPVTLAAGGVLDLNGNSETIAAPAGAGVVDNTAPGSSSVLTTGNGGTVFGGSLRASGAVAELSLVKSGAGEFTLLGTNFHTGGTTVRGGVLALGDLQQAGSRIYRVRIQ